jgi:secondary thiamine-phosphate synthase enzyme
MTVETKYIALHTKGNGDVLNITEEVQDHLTNCKITAGIVTIFTPSATSGLTTLEYEPGCVKDIQRLFDEIIPPDRDYAHNQRWGDGNGHSHARAALLKPFLSIPFVEKELILGTWQSIIFVDFDNRDRQRKLVVQILGD